MRGATGGVGDGNASLLPHSPHHLLVASFPASPACLFAVSPLSGRTLQMMGKKFDLTTPWQDTEPYFAHMRYERQLKVSKILMKKVKRRRKKSLVQGYKIDGMQVCHRSVKSHLSPDRE